MSAHQVAKTFFASISFSGAGFLGCYHIGVASCLLKHGYLVPPGEAPKSSTSQHTDYDHHPPPVLLGASAGALMCANIIAGVRTEDSMDVALKLAHVTRKEGGIMDAFRPGFSLVDEVDKLLYPTLYEAVKGDEELFQRRLRSRHGTSLLRIALTDKRQIVSPADNMKAYRYADTYRDIKDVCAAAILSSYIPGVTGPFKGANCQENLAVYRAWKRMQSMIKLGFVRDGTSGEALNITDLAIPVSSSSVLNDNEKQNETYWDGGLSNMWPILDDKTLVVSSLNGNFTPNPYIVPNSQVFESSRSQEEVQHTLSQPFMITLNERTKVQVDRENLKSMWNMCFSSDDRFLEEKFQEGYDDTSRHLKDHNLLRVFA